MRVSFSKRFSKNYNRSPVKVRKAFDGRLNIFLKDKFNPVLNNHPLTGKYAGYRSINITGNWRAVFREFQEGEIIYFDTLGTHSQLYE